MVDDSLAHRTKEGSDFRMRGIDVSRGLFPDDEQLGSWEWNPLAQDTRFVLKKTPDKVRLTFQQSFAPE